MSLVSKESPLRKLPSALARDQVIFLDGIRHAVDIGELAYGRLRLTLTDLALSDDPGDSELTPHFTAAFLDAWAFVDVMDRFRNLLRQMPGAEALTQGPLADFLDRTNPLRSIRNVGDHLATRVPYVIANRGTALGTLSWFTVPDPADVSRGLSCCIMPGTIHAIGHPIATPTGKTLEIPTDGITLAAGEYQVNLSAVMRELTRVIPTIEAGLRKGLEAAGVPDDTSGTDVLLVYKISFAEGGSDAASTDA